MVLPFRITTLETFDASESGVDANGIFVFATYAMMFPLNLRFLLLDYNPIGKDGLQEIIHCLTLAKLHRVSVKGAPAASLPRGDEEGWLAEHTRGYRTRLEPEEG